MSYEPKSERTGQCRCRHNHDILLLSETMQRKSLQIPHVQKTLSSATKMNEYPDKTCLHCGLTYRILTWQAHQRSRYCSDKCKFKAERKRKQDRHRA